MDFGGGSNSLTISIFGARMVEIDTLSGHAQGVMLITWEVLEDVVKLVHQGTNEQEYLETLSIGNETREKNNTSSHTIIQLTDQDSEANLLVKWVWRVT